MSNIWSTEARALILAAATLMLLGWLSGNWFVSGMLTCGGYISWLYWRLLKLEKWIRNGTRMSEVYDDPGFLGIIIRQLYK